MLMYDYEYNYTYMMMMIIRNVFVIMFWNDLQENR